MQSFENVIPHVADISVLLAKRRVFWHNLKDCCWRLTEYSKFLCFRKMLCVPPFLSCTKACVWVCVLIFAAVYSCCFCCCFFADILLMRVLCLFLVLGSKFHLHMSPYSTSRSFYFSRDQRPFLSTPFVIQRLYLFVCRPKVENLVILCACTCETISTPWSRLV